jgi:hypothetical protein
MSLNTPTSNPPQSPDQNPILAPSDSEKVTNYYSANNVVLAGTNNDIVDSQRCSILNGANNYISGKYNTHIIGDYIGLITGNNSSQFPVQNNSFHIGCYNGLHVYGDVVAFASSDERLKDNIVELDNCLDKVLSLDAIEFNWNDNQETYRGHDIGLIAQQVERIAPEIVTTRENGYKAVKYDKVNTLLVGAIKEQQKIIESLEDRISKLENQTQ